VGNNHFYFYGGKVAITYAEKFFLVQAATKSFKQERQRYASMSLFEQLPKF